MTPEAVLDELVDAHYRAQLEPPPSPRFLLDFARALKNPTGEFQGMPYDPTLHAGQITFLLLVAISLYPGDLATLARPDGVSEMLWRAVLRLGRFVRFVLVGDTQSGKSWTLQVVAFYLLCERKADLLYGLQDMRSASDTWTMKLQPAMRLGGLREFLPRSGSGSGGGSDIDTVHLYGAGSIIFNGAGGHRGHSGIDGRSIPNILDDELDSIPMDVVNKNEARADAFFRSARIFRASTVKDDEASNILASYNQGIQLHIEYRCPSCRAFTPLEDEQVSTLDKSTDRAAAETTRIACARCATLLTEAERKRMLQGDFVPVALGQTVLEDGTVVGDPPDSSVCSLRWTCYDNPFKSIGHVDQVKGLVGMAVKRRLAEIEAKNGRTKDLDDFYHDDLVRVAPIQVREEDVDAQALASRSAAASYARTQIPVGARFLVLSVDQQKRLLLWKVKAYDLEGRRWSVDWGMEPICAPRIEPTPEQRIEALGRIDAIAARGWRRQDSTEVLRPVMIGVDVADWPDIAERFMRGKRNWIAVHGAGAEMVKKMKRGTGKKVGELHGWYVVIEYEQPRAWRMLWPESDSVKKEVSRSFARVIDGPGSSMLPAGLGVHDDLVKHLTAERWQYSKDLKRHAWIKVGQYNDLWDCNYYNDTIAQWWIAEHPNYRAPGTAGAKRAKDRDDEDDTVDLSWSPNMGRFV